MFDAIAPRYDLVNRIMTFRMDVRWRRRTVESLQLAAGRDRGRPGLRHRRPLPRARRRGGLEPIGVDLSFGMLAAARTEAPLVHGDALRLPFPDGRGGRRHLRVRPAQLRQPAAVLRRAGAGRAARGADRAARGGGAAQPDPPLGPRRLLRQGRAARGRAALGPRRLPLPAPVRRLPARARTRCSTSCGPPASWTSNAGCCRSASRSSITARRAGARDVTELVARTRRVDQDLDLLELAGRRRRAARTSPGGAGGARGGRARTGVQRRRRARRHGGRRRGRRARHGPGGLRRPPVPA